MRRSLIMSMTTVVKSSPRTGHDNIFKWNSSEDTTGTPCYTLEVIQTLYGQNDKENGKDFYNSVFSRKSENVLSFHEFSRTFRSTKTEKLS